jgi:hypothetical protein
LPGQLPPQVVTGPAQSPSAQAQAQPNQQPADEPKKKKGFFGRIFGGDKKDNQNQQPPQTQPQ